MCVWYIYASPRNDLRKKTLHFSWLFLTGIVTSVSCAFSTRSFLLQPEILWNSSRRHGVFMLISLSSVTSLSLLCGFCATMHPIIQVPPEAVVGRCNCCCHLFGACTVDVRVFQPPGHWCSQLGPLAPFCTGDTVLNIVYMSGIATKISCAFSARSFLLQILRNSFRWHSVFILLSLSSVTKLSLLFGLRFIMKQIAPQARLINRNTPRGRARWFWLNLDGYSCPYSMQSIFHTAGFRISKV